MNCGICFFFFQAEDGIRDLVRSRGLGDVYKRQAYLHEAVALSLNVSPSQMAKQKSDTTDIITRKYTCLLYTSDAADERSSVDLGGRRIIKKKTKDTYT